MPKRILDDSLLSSPSLAKCSPRAQDAWPRFILLMDDFGCAEANPRVLLGRGWPLRDDVSERDVWSWLEEYVAAGMACLWTEKERRWVFLTGWFGPHGQKRRAEYDPRAPENTPGRHGSKRKTPTPPEELVAAVVAGARRDHDGKPPGIDREGDSEILKDSVPARETTGNAAGISRETCTSRPLPAYAVAVADAPTTPPPTRVRAREASSGTEPPGFAGSTPAATPVSSPGPRGDGSEGPTLALRRLSPLPTPESRAAELYPATTALLAALDAAGEGMSHAARDRRGDVERAIASVGVETATRRLLAAVKRHPSRKRFLGFWLEDIRREVSPVRVVGDLGAEAHPWFTQMTDEERRAYVAERHAVAPGLDEAPIGIIGPDLECAALNSKWRQLVENRLGGVA